MAKNTDAGLRELARQLNLSETTVSRALSGNGRISVATRERVRALAEEMGYASPSQKKQSQYRTSSGHSGNVAVVLSRDLLYESEFFHLALLGAAATLAEHNYETLVILCNSNEYRPLRQAVEKGKIDGVIFTRSIEQERSIAPLKKQGLPVVLLGSGNKDAVLVDGNISLACRELVACIAAYGARRIAYIGGNTNYIVNENRQRGVEKGIFDQDIHADSSLIFNNVETKEDCFAAVENAIAHQADAIIGGDDVLTEWAFEALVESGLSVPGDMLLASCFDSSAMAQHTPPITAVHIDARAQGIAAAQAMVQLLHGQEVKHMIRTEHEIMIRQSTRRKR
ncbi:MAG: LacI family transcriptional regulator [Lachnospiraceae bacterium]|nr:LacI family transcriptional regulator [Lachnospiraceae bacterium]